MFTSMEVDIMNYNNVRQYTLHLMRVILCSPNFQKLFIQNSIFGITNYLLKTIQWLHISLKIKPKLHDLAYKICHILSHLCLFIPSIPISQMTDKLIYVSVKLNYFLFHNCNTFPCVTHTLQMLFFLSRSPSPILLTKSLSHYHLSDYHLLSFWRDIITLELTNCLFATIIYHPIISL